jgi:hypothetical protein
VSPAPNWAQNLVRRVWLDEGREGEALPHLAWRSRNDRYSSGKACPCCNRILVTAGTDRADAKLVLLHECGHLLTRQGHTAAFWDKVWRLYRRHRVPIRYALEREGNYRKGAVKAYERSRSRT